MGPTRTRSLVVMLLGALAAGGCVLPKCDALCQRQADCVEQTLSENGASWEEWTGFADRDAYVEACFGVFTDSRDAGAGRRELQRTCKAELGRDTCS